jgi:hypothetical protein
VDGYILRILARLLRIGRAIADLRKHPRPAGRAGTAARLAPGGGLPCWIIVSAGEVSEKDVDHVDRPYRSEASRPSGRWRGPRRSRSLLRPLWRGRL